MGPLFETHVLASPPFLLRSEAVYPTFGAHLKHIFQRVHHFCLQMRMFTLPLELIWNTFFRHSTGFWKFDKVSKFHYEVTKKDWGFIFQMPCLNLFKCWSEWLLCFWPIKLQNQALTDRQPIKLGARVRSNGCGATIGFGRCCGVYNWSTGLSYVWPMITNSKKSNKYETFVVHRFIRHTNYKKNINSVYR